jgi:transketolase
MHRNGIQLSGSNRMIMDKDPRPVIESLGISILEIESLHDPAGLFRAYQESFSLARSERPSMIFPTGTVSGSKQRVDLNFFGEKYGVSAELKEYAEENGVSMETEIWIPGALMSFRDVPSMIECLFLVNELKGGKGHHDGHMKGRDLEKLLKNSMLQMPAEYQEALDQLKNQEKTEITTKARPAPGSPNLTVAPDVLNEVQLPGTQTWKSARAGVEAAYAALSKSNPDQVFVVSCDLDTSTKLEKARGFLSRGHQFEMSIEEQASALMANGLAMSTGDAQFNIFSTFAAFFEGIAREGFEFWRYQRNLNGVNEGLNVTFHLSHVGACTGRDHFSGWSLDWINLALGYLPYLHRFYTPADARNAFLAVKDAAAHYGGHIVGIPRDNLPILEKQAESEPLWEKDDAWTATTVYRSYPGAKRVILAVGAPAFLAAEAAGELLKDELPTDVIIINGFPLEPDFFEDVFNRYTEGIVTIEDGLTGSGKTGLRGFAGMISGAGRTGTIPMEHIGIIDPRVAPSEGHIEVWAHFGLTKDALISAVKSF